MTKAVFVKAGRGLLPADEEAQEIMFSMSEGKEVLIDIHSPRNIRHHKLFFALLRVVVKAGAWSGEEEELRKALLIEVGYVTVVHKLDGTITHQAKSMNFASLPQNKFNRLFDRCIWVVTDQLLESDNWEVLREEIFLSVDGEMGSRVKEHDERYAS